MARILIVDDQSMNRELIHAYLEDTGHELVDAETGEKALALAKESPPDLVLMDVMMPGLNGFEATRQLKSGTGGRFLPIIMLTSLSDEVSRVLGLRMGADDVMTKPVNRMELGVRIKHLLALREKEIALNEMNAALADLHRFKDEMSTLIVHDLKNPLWIIVANLKYLIEELPDAPPTVVEALNDSKSAGQRLLRLLANLLDVSRADASRLQLKRAPCDLMGLLFRIAAERSLSAATRDIAITVVSAPSLSVEIDVDLLTRAVENVFDNALRHTPAGGRIEVSVLATPGQAQIRIGNTGSHVAENLRAVIFEKFGQAAPGTVQMSLGLGLYFCRLALEAHGGSICVEETEAFPTVFVMRLPTPR